MRTLTRLMLLTTAFAVAFACIASAQEQKPRKHKKVAAHSSKVVSAARGEGLYPRGPLYNGPDYIGDDPDPFIRSQLMRDLSGRYGGDSN
jgi:hypothetical protein